MEVTPLLVERDDGGRLIRKLVALEAILDTPGQEALEQGALSRGQGEEEALERGALSGGEKDINSSLPLPPTPCPPASLVMPPQLVVNRDHSERENLKICTDWANHSTSWLMRHRLGLREILMPMMQSDEQLTADDERIVALAQQSRLFATHIKAILNLTIPSDQPPMWIFGKFLEQLGLHCDWHRIGGRGQQVKYFFLDPSDLEFALSVLTHRENQRYQKEQRRQQDREAQQRLAAGRAVQYGIEESRGSRGSRGREELLNNSSLSSSAPEASSAPPASSTPVVTSPPNLNGEHFRGDVTTDPESPEQPHNSWFEKIKGFASLVVEGLGYGIEIVKELLSTLTIDERWGVIFEFEATNPDEFGIFVSNVPNWAEYLEL
jgi:hypothetical protein